MQQSETQEQGEQVEKLLAAAKTPSRPRSHFNSRRVNPTRETVERILPNGDVYIGNFSGYVRVPHGIGKYVWSDGCTYEGEWKRGKACGKGYLSWPSGATYQGHFKSGHMDGQGTFIGVDGDTYTGSWYNDRKHGYGERRYANGDVYQGSWKFNLMDGHGKYTWSQGHVYSGDWQNGVISGKGLLTCSHGNSVYEGPWQNGFPKGKPPPPLFSFCNNTSSAQSHDGSYPPRLCIWEFNGDAGDITCDIVHNVPPNPSRDAKHCGNNFHIPALPDQHPHAPINKKPGHTISKGHKNYDLMLNLQLGIRYSVGKHASVMRELRHSDFDPKEKFWTRFPPDGSKFTPPHQSVDFRWKDYCPMVFRHLRELFAIDPAAYMLAICGNDALREFSSPGKSGSFFYLTQDDRFIIKTVKKSEVKVLIRMLQNYYQHVCQYNNSLVTKFFGVHCVKPVGGQKTRFIVMGNLFCSEYRIHKRFDLKGSSHGRITDKPVEEIDETTTLKDLDLNFVFRLERSWFQELIRQIDRDCEFLEAERIMDYSLLIGLHFRDDYSDDEIKMSLNDKHIETRDIDTFVRGYHLLPDMDWVMEGRGSPMRLGANMPARAERLSRIRIDQYMGSRSSNSTPSPSGGEYFDVVLYFGIIDILQDYDISKKLEHAYKSLQVDPVSISAVDPKLYSKRFRDFIHRVFVVDKDK